LTGCAPEQPSRVTSRIESRFEAIERDRGVERSRERVDHGARNCHAWQVMRTGSASYLGGRLPRGCLAVQASFTGEDH